MGAKAITNPTATFGFAAIFIEDSNSNHVSFVHPIDVKVRGKVINLNLLIIYVDASIRGASKGINIKFIFNMVGMM